MMAATPRVSVIIPTYNWSGVLPYSVGSVLWQTFTAFEVLVVGDGCTDDSGTAVERVGDPRVHWINLPMHTGHQSRPNNEGLRRARGEFIAYLGHDDLWLPHHLSCLTFALDAGADLAYGITESVGPEGSYARPDPPMIEYRPGIWMAPTAVVHRRSVTDHVGGWRDYREVSVDPEADLWLRAHTGGHRFAFVPRLTAIKFPAAWRRDIYKIRPHHEQAAWFDRIQNEGDFEMVELAKMLVAAQQAVLSARQEASGERPYRLLLRYFLQETRRRIWRRLFPPKAQVAHIEAYRKYIDIVEARREFKGLTRRPSDDR